MKTNHLHLIQRHYKSIDIDEIEEMEDEIEYKEYQEELEKQNDKRLKQRTRN